MSKLIKLEGVAKEIVVTHCIECPLNYQGEKCILAFHLRSENIPEPDIILEGSFPKDCPLPDYVDENEHTAPDGTELVAVESVGIACSALCHYLVTPSSGSLYFCARPAWKNCCGKILRKDGRNIAWVPKSEVK